VAEADHSAVGEAWWHYLSKDAPGYEYVRDDVPEVTIAVRPAQRRSGIGRRFTEGLTEAAITNFNNLSNINR
jgi:hypothetical protein